MKRWNRILAAVVATMVVAGVAGCGGGSSSNNSSNAAPKPSDSTSAAPVQVTFWGDWGGDGQKQFETMVDAFNKSQNKIQVKYVLTQDMITKFLTAATSGGAPDIMFWDRVNTALYAPKNVLTPIDDFMTKSSVPKSDFYDQAIQELSYGGHLYGLPITVDARAIFYNKKLLAAANVQPPKTWDEVEQVAKATTKWDGNKLVQSGFSLNDVGLFNMYLQQAGGSMLTSDGTKTNFNNDKGMAVLNYWSKLMNDKVYQVGFEQGLGDKIDAFATGKLAMMYSGPWMLSTYKKADGLDFGVAPAPAGPGGDKGSVMGGFGLVIPKGAKHAQEAWEFMKWWCAQPENSLLWAKTSLNIPGNLKAIQDPFFQSDPFWKPFLDTLQFAKIRPPVAGYSPMEVNGVMPQLQLFMEGKQDAATTLKNAQTQGDTLLSQNAVK